MEIIFSFLPVLLFLFILYMLDSFKLVKSKTLVMCLLWGVIAAFLAYYANNWLREQLSLKFEVFSRYAAPLTEEIFKVSLVVYLISRKKIGFTVDAAIYGFAAGAGFSLAENMFYLLVLNTETGMMVWLLRGFGTAMMHGGCTALFAMIILDGINRNKPLVVAFFPGLITGFLIHSVFNHFFLNPFLQTAVTFIVLPLIFVVMFQKSNAMLQNWLEIEFNSEVEMLRMIRQGNISHTKAGNYLISLKQHFSPEVLVDLYCYFSLYLELSIKAKRNLMLKENGFPLIEEADIIEKLMEVKLLRKQIGKLGELALQPLVRMNHRELWKLNLLKN
ncbi:MAG: PrsW family intramembrane metalloprotease [Bacteroidetes bacterium]|nr:PrsW family intramembrane metalloprotease [Bacteroidota bacterium]MBU1579954.1 PrsW family intramembrane metalloprotease [Bacteroidota bacterium]MBU2466200.1 PrsW family intramembrane metalloprotease [Bacteroidota bacterium]MBU2558698.1 PrsW family intramembrane metalloprotease [Bacteroidota bacterium]